MDSEQLKNLLGSLQTGKIGIDQALEKLKGFPYDDLGFAKIDTHRALRRGFPEAIFCEGKTPEQVTKIVLKMSKNNEIILAMRAQKNTFTAVKKVTDKAKYYESAKAIVIGKIPKIKNKNKILIISAGTADMPVAEEAALTAQCMGNAIDRLYDAGVAGVHRLLQNRE
ncbi:MAG: 1-(5-phosphoribosyl)-5-amino-4-imidazole-carboxylate carboxylase, partial [bacterium]